jgi:hypothetical protein
MPPTLRAVSCAIDGTIVEHRAISDRDAPDDKDLLSITAAEIIADFAAECRTSEEYLDVALVEQNFAWPERSAV